MTTSKQKFERVGCRTSIFKRKGTWYVNYQQQDGRQVRKSLKTRNKVVATRKAGQIESELREGEIPSQPQATSVETLISEYIQSLVTNGRATKTLAKYRCVLRRFDKLLTGEDVARVTQIRARHLQKYRNARSEAGCQAKTIYNETVILLQLMKFAKRMDYITTEPFKNFPNPEPRPARQPCWTPEETERILESAKDQDRLAFTILADSGIRLGELQWLSWDDIDLEGRTLQVREKDDWKPKTGDQRSVPLSRRLVTMLSVTDPVGRWVIIRPHTAADPEPRQLNPRRLLAALKRILKGLGLEGHLHTFRHSFISKALLGGTPEAVVRDWVGHVDPAILKLYTHVTHEQSQRFIDRLSTGSHAGSPISIGGISHDDSDLSSAQNQHNARNRKNKKAATIC